MEPDFYTKRTQQLLLSGYPVHVDTVDCSAPNAPIIHWHWHEEIEFQYIQKGQAYITCEEDNIAVSEGDIFFINQAVRHFITPSGPNGVIYSAFVVHPSFILGFGQLELESKYINPVLANCSFTHLHITRKNKHYEQFLALLKQLLALHEERPVCYELLSKANILQLWKLLYDHLDQLPGRTAAPYKITARIANQDAQRVKQAMVYIQEHFMEPITLNDIAEAILVSKSECCRCFKRGCTPTEYRQSLRRELPKLN